VWKKGNGSVLAVTQYMFKRRKPMMYPLSPSGKSKLPMKLSISFQSFVVCALMLATSAASMGAQTTPTAPTKPLTKVPLVAKPPATAKPSAPAAKLPQALAPHTNPVPAPAQRPTAPGTAAGAQKATNPNQLPTSSGKAGVVQPRGETGQLGGTSGQAARGAGQPGSKSGVLPPSKQIQSERQLPGGVIEQHHADGSIRVMGPNNKVRGFESGDHNTHVAFGPGGRPESVRHVLPGGGVMETHRLPNGQFVSRTERPDRDGRMMRIESRGGIGHIDRPIFGRNGFYRENHYDRGHSYAYVDRRYGWHGYNYYRTIPPYIYAPGFYAWGINPWVGGPIAYGWGWQAQPWYGAYGQVFTPYQQYAGLDQWMTDYVIATNMRLAYEASQGAPPPPAYADSSLPLAPPSDSMPPVITDDMKAQIAAQVKLEMEEQQAVAAKGPVGAAGPPTGPGNADATPPEDMPDALKDGHTIFRVVTPVSLQVAGQVCTLNADDYITRTGDLKVRPSTPEGTVAVKIKASRAADCSVGGTADIALNDLMVMESDQQQRIQEGFKEASIKMGKAGGLPAGPAPGEVAVPLGQTAVDPDLAAQIKNQQAQASQAEKDAIAQAGTQ
jgi:hypothetical protein